MLHKQMDQFCTFVYIMQEMAGWPSFYYYYYYYYIIIIIIKEIYRAQDRPKATSACCRFVIVIFVIYLTETHIRFAGNCFTF